jgi:hypothetical protein
MLLDLTEQVDDLAEMLIRRRVLPANAVEDAAHIAVATIHKVDYLVTWNFRHIANATKMAALRGLCVELGYVLPVICTPEELMRGRI